MKTYLLNRIRDVNGKEMNSPEFIELLEKLEQFPAGPTKPLNEKLEKLFAEEPVDEDHGLDRGRMWIVTPDGLKREE